MPWHIASLQVYARLRFQKQTRDLSHHFR